MKKIIKLIAMSLVAVLMAVTLTACSGGLKALKDRLDTVEDQLAKLEEKLETERVAVRAQLAQLEADKAALLAQVGGLETDSEELAALVKKIDELTTRAYDWDNPIIIDEVGSYYNLYVSDYPAFFKKYYNKVLQVTEKCIGSTEICDGAYMVLQNEISRDSIAINFNTSYLSSYINKRVTVQAVCDKYYYARPSYGRVIDSQDIV